MRITFLKTIFLFLVFSVLVSFSIVNAQTVSPTPAVSQQKISDLQNEINDLENKVNDLKNQQKTLASQISVMDNQIKLTQLRINATEQELTDLTLDIDTADKKISTLQNSLEKLTKILIGRIVATYEVGTIQPFHILLSSDNVSSFFVRLNYLKIAQEHDKRLIFDTTQAKNDYSNQKEIFEDKKQKVESLQAQLEAYNSQLDQDKVNKERLLAETKGSEANYQRLLANARAEYEAIQGIIAGKGEDVFIRDVNQGDSIGSIASISISPGCSTGSHLHFEVQNNGSIQNPNSYLKQVGYSYSYSSEQYGYYGTINPTGDLPWPLNEPVIINQGYGSHGYAQTYYPGGTHTGIDMDSSSSTVKTVEAGKLYGGSYNCKNGKLYYSKVIHDDGLISWYLHMLSN